MSEARRIALERLGVLLLGRNMACSDFQPGRTRKLHSPSDHAPAWVYANPRSRRPFADRSIELFNFLPKEASVSQAAESSDFLVILGAEKTPQLDELMQTENKVLLVFEPCEKALDAFLAEVGVPALTKPGVFIFAGDPYSFSPTLQDSLPPKLFRRGHPVFIASERIRGGHAAWADRVIEYIEILYYRHALYLTSSHSFLRFQPFRPMTRELYFDQQLHAYENIREYCRWPDVSHLKGALEGCDAILVAAGPGLTEKLDYIKKNNDRAVVICVNNACKPLIEAGVAPHFVIINDPSCASGQVFKHIPVMPDAILVGHCRSDLGGDRFHRKYLFGSHLEELFGERQDLEAHGSVITAAYSLARLLGCSRCIVVGGQLSSNNPWSLDYAQGTLHERKGLMDKTLIHQHPQLYPVINPFGGKLYTTLNFRDAALWLAENVRIDGIEFVNTTQDSILYGEGISFDPNPTPPNAAISAKLGELNPPTPPVDLARVAEHIGDERRRWQSIRDETQTLLEAGPSELLNAGTEKLQQFDEANVTYLVQRFETFDNQKFHTLAFDSDANDRAEGLRYYFAHVQRLCETFLKVLEEQTQHMRNLPK